MYHYWISNNKRKILDVYKMITPGETVEVKRKIYKRIKEIKTNRTISLVENKVISELNIIDTYFRVVISDRCRVLYNDKITIVEMDGHNTDVATEIFSLIANNEEEFVIFDIDNTRIEVDPVTLNIPLPFWFNNPIPQDKLVDVIKFSDKKINITLK